MVEVEHTRHTIEPEPVELVLVHPKPEIAQEEPHDLVVTVVEQPAIPLIMTPLATFVEVLVIAPVKFVQSVENILRGMAVDYVQQYNKAYTVSGVDELLQILGRAVATARGEEIVDLVSKAGVVGMLHDRHELDDIVAEPLDPGKHVPSKLLVGRDPELGGRDSNVCLIHASTERLLGPGMLEDISVLGGRVPEPGVISRRHREILGNILNPGRETVDSLTAWDDQRYLAKQCQHLGNYYDGVATHLDLGVVRYSNLAVFVRRHHNLKDTKFIFLHWVGVAVPTVYKHLVHGAKRWGAGESVILTKVSDEVCLLSVGCPFPVDDVVVAVDVQAECIGALARDS